MRTTIEQVSTVASVTIVGTSLDDLRSRFARSGIAAAVEDHDSAALFDWFLEVVSYQGIGDAVAARYMDEHGTIRFSDVEDVLDAHPTCPRLQSYWHFDECRFRKVAFTCSEPNYISACPLPYHDLRNGRLNQTAYALFLFIRDVCNRDLIGWIDERLDAADQPEAPDRAARMRQALLEPLGCVHGVSSKVLSMALADLLLGADPARERWVTAGASMIAIDTLVHNWLHRTGCLRRLQAEHAYGPACYGPHGCAEVIEALATQIDARQFCADGPAFFPRLLQKAIWQFCANLHLDMCNGNRIDDHQPCEQQTCPLFSRCERLPLHSVVTA